MLETIFQQSLELTAWLQGLGDWLYPVMHFFTFLGTENFYMLVLPVFLWAVDYALGYRLGVMLLLTSGINDLAKMVFRQPRPYWVKPDALKFNDPSAGFGIPSGHSQTPLSIFGLLAATYKKLWLTITVIFVVFMIGLSRIFLGEHFTIDVLSGWAMGGLVLFGFIKLEPRVRACFTDKTISTKLLTVLGFALAFILLAALVVSIPAGYQLPQEWVDNALAAFPEAPIKPLTIKNAITSMATLFGLSAGYFWIEQRGGFNAASESWIKRLLRFPIGLVGVVIFWMGLGAIFPDDPLVLGWVLRFFRYALVGFWISGAAPYLFMAFNLGRPQRQ